MIYHHHVKICYTCFSKTEIATLWLCWVQNCRWVDPTSLIEFCCEKGAHLSLRKTECYSVLLVAELIVIMLQLLQALQYLHFLKKLLLVLGCFVSVFESETKCESHSHIFMSFWNQICNSTDYIYFNLMIYKFTQQEIGDITNDSFTVWYVLKIQSSLEEMCPIYQWKSCMAHFHQMYNLCCDWYLLDLSVV